MTSKDSKMKNMTKVILATSVLSLALASFGSFAKGGNDTRGDRGGDQRRSEQCQRQGERAWMMDELNLTPEQRTQMRKLHQDNRDAMRDKRQANQGQMRALHQKENQIVMAKNFDEKAAQSLAKQMVNIQAENRVEHMKKRFETMSVLTPEQKAKFTELQQKKFVDCNSGKGMRRADDDRGVGKHKGNGKY
jgi:periplasmic protein CpxP/Spy